MIQGIAGGDLEPPSRAAGKARRHDSRLLLRRAACVSTQKGFARDRP